MPASQIQPVGEETFNGVKALALGLDQVLRDGSGTQANNPNRQKPNLPRPGFPGFPIRPIRPQGYVDGMTSASDEPSEISNNTEEPEP